MLKLSCVSLDVGIGARLTKKFRMTVLTMLSYHDVAYTFDKHFLSNLFSECKVVQKSGRWMVGRALYRSIAHPAGVYPSPSRICSNSKSPHISLESPKQELRMCSYSMEMVRSLLLRAVEVIVSLHVAHCWPNSSLTGTPR